MSLINDMLKDLDIQRVRRNTASDTALFGLGLSGDVNSATQKSLVIVIATSMLLLLAVLAWPHATENLAHPYRQTAISNDHPAQPSPQPHASGNQESAPRPTPARAARNTPTADETSPENEPLEIPLPEDQHGQALQADTQESGQGDSSSHIVVHQPNEQERMQLNYQQAASATRAGHYSTAEALLAENLALDAAGHDTRLLLADLYIRQEYNHKAESLLSEALVNYPENTAYALLYAQLLVARSHYSEALKLMQAALPGAGRDADYQAMIAGLYQRTGQPFEAATYYRRALQLSPARGEWWMGLGLSLEQSGSTVNAYAAYQRALRHPLSPALQKYVKTRLYNLPRQPGQG